MSPTHPTHPLPNLLPTPIHTLPTCPLPTYLPNLFIQVSVLGLIYKA